MDTYSIVKGFYECYSGEKRIYGKSLFGRNLFALKCGSGAPVGIAQYAIHGREYITTRLALAQITRGVTHGSVWFLPITNPDGVALSEIGLVSAPNIYRERLLTLNANRKDFSLWKANGRGVDLNVNFAARWGKGKKNVRIAGAENYVGTYPFSERETRALRSFTLDVCPDYTVSYHTKGEEIYWYFYQHKERKARDLRLAEELSRLTGYPLREAQGSVGGYKDWCIRRFKIPSFTIEVGRDEHCHPLGEEALKDILARNIDAIDGLSERIENEKTYERRKIYEKGTRGGKARS